MRGGLSLMRRQVGNPPPDGGVQVEVGKGIVGPTRALLLRPRQTPF